MKYERLLQAQEDSLLLLLFQDSFTWEIIIVSDSGLDELYIQVRATYAAHNSEHFTATTSLHPQWLLRFP